MKILILSCNTGEGHNSAGKAVMEAALLRGHEVEFMDLMLLGGKTVSHMVGGAYISIVRHIPAFFSLLYKVGGLISSSTRKSPVYYANSLLAGRLDRYIKEHSFDLILTPHLYAAEVLTCLKHRGLLSVPVIAIGTDYTCIPFWEETDCDCYIVPQKDLLGELIHKGLPKKRLFPLGIPVKQAFSTQKKRSLARKFCRLPSDAHVYLVMSGSMGFGKVNLLVAELIRKLEADEYVVVICGNNRRLRQILQTTFGKNPQVRILGFTDHVPAYMDASDVIFSKPGGLTSTEAAVRQIALVHTSPIPGCETKYLAFFTSHGMSVTARTVHGQVTLGRRLMKNEDARIEMQKQQNHCIPHDSAVEICRLAEKLYAQRNHLRYTGFFSSLQDIFQEVFFLPT